MATTSSTTAAATSATSSDAVKHYFDEGLARLQKKAGDKLPRLRTACDGARARLRDWVDPLALAHPSSKDPAKGEHNTGTAKDGSTAAPQKLLRRTSARSIDTAPPRDRTPSPSLSQDPQQQVPLSGEPCPVTTPARKLCRLSAVRRGFPTEHVVYCFNMATDAVVEKRWTSKDTRVGLLRLCVAGFARLADEGLLSDEVVLNQIPGSATGVGKNVVQAALEILVQHLPSKRVDLVLLILKAMEAIVTTSFSHSNSTLLLVVAQALFRLQITAPVAEVRTEAKRTLQNCLLSIQHAIEDHYHASRAAALAAAVAAAAVTVSAAAGSAVVPWALPPPVNPLMNSPLHGRSYSLPAGAFASHASSNGGGGGGGGVFSGSSHNTTNTTPQLSAGAAGPTFSSRLEFSPASGTGTPAPLPPPVPPAWPQQQQQQQGVQMVSAEVSTMTPLSPAAVAAAAAAAGAATVVTSPRLPLLDIRDPGQLPQRAKPSAASATAIAAAAPAADGTTPASPTGAAAAASSLNAYSNPELPGSERVAEHSLAEELASMRPPEYNLYRVIKTLCALGVEDVSTETEADSPLVVSRVSALELVAFLLGQGGDGVVRSPRLVGCIKQPVLGAVLTNLAATVPASLFGHALNILEVVVNRFQKYMRAEIACAITGVALPICRSPTTSFAQRLAVLASLESYLPHLVTLFLNNDAAVDGADLVSNIMSTLAFLSTNQIVVRGWITVRQSLLTRFRAASILVDVVHAVQAALLALPSLADAGSGAAGTAAGGGSLLLRSRSSGPSALSLMRSSGDSDADGGGGPVDSGAVAGGARRRTRRSSLARSARAAVTAAVPRLGGRGRRRDEDSADMIGGGTDSSGLGGGGCGGGDTPPMFSPKGLHASSSTLTAAAAAGSAAEFPNTSFEGLLADRGTPPPPPLPPASTGAAAAAAFSASAPSIAAGRPPQHGRSCSGTLPVTCADLPAPPAHPTLMRRSSVSAAMVATASAATTGSSSVPAASPPAVVPAPASEEEGSAGLPASTGAGAAPSLSPPPSPTPQPPAVVAAPTAPRQATSPGVLTYHACRDTELFQAYSNRWVRRHVLAAWRKSWKKGLEMCLRYNVLPDKKPTTVARFLFDNAKEYRLCPSAVGELLLKNENWSHCCLCEYLHLMDLRSLPLDQAIRSLLQRFVMLGEAMVVERLMHALVSEYAVQNEHHPMVSPAFGAFKETLDVVVPHRYVEEVLADADLSLPSSTAGTPPPSSSPAGRTTATYVTDDETTASGGAAEPSVQEQPKTQPQPQQQPQAAERYPLACVVTTTASDSDAYISVKIKDSYIGSSDDLQRTGGVSRLASMRLCVRKDRVLKIDFIYITAIMIMMINTQKNSQVREKDKQSLDSQIRTLLDEADGSLSFEAIAALLKPVHDQELRLDPVFSFSNKVCIAAIR